MSEEHGPECPWVCKHYPLIVSPEVYAKLLEFADMMKPVKPKRSARKRSKRK